MSPLTDVLVAVPDGQFLVADFTAQTDDGTMIIVTAILERVVVGHLPGQDEERRVIPIRQLSVDPSAVRYAPLSRHELSLRRARYRAGSASPWRTHPGGGELAP